MAEQGAEAQRLDREAAQLTALLEKFVPHISAVTETLAIDPPNEVASA